MSRITPTPKAAAIAKRGMMAILKTVPAEMGMRAELDSEGNGTIHYDGRVWRVRKVSYEIGYNQGIKMFWRATDNGGVLPHIDGETPMDLQKYLIFGKAYNDALREAKPC